MTEPSQRRCQSLSHVWLFVTPWTVARQAPLSMVVLYKYVHKFFHVKTIKDGIYVTPSEAGGVFVNALDE